MYFRNFAKMKIFRFIFILFLINIKFLKFNNGNLMPLKNTTLSFENFKLTEHIFKILRNLKSTVIYTYFDLETSNELIEKILEQMEYCEMTFINTNQR